MQTFQQLLLKSEWYYLISVLGIYFSLKCIIMFLLQIASRMTRTVCILYRGWPPAHLDADGDWENGDWETQKEVYP